MNQNCNNMRTTVDQIQRLLDNLYELSNTLEITELVDLGFVKTNFKSYIYNLCRELEIKSSFLPDLQEMVDIRHDIADILSFDEFMDLEFINEFGVSEFIGLADEHCIDKLLDLYNVIRLKSSVLFSSFHSDGYSRCDGNHKRAKRRISNVKARTRAIQLGSSDIYSENGKLVRKCGFIGHKVCEAENNFFKFNEAKEKDSTLLFSKLELKAFAKAIRKGKRYVKFAEKYEDYTFLCMGRYFNINKKASTVPNDIDNSSESADIVAKNGSKNVYYVRLSEDCVDSKYRYSGLYAKITNNDTSMIEDIEIGFHIASCYEGVDINSLPKRVKNRINKAIMSWITYDLLQSKGLTDELPESEKGDVPISIRRNKHAVKVYQPNAKVSNLSVRHAYSPISRYITLHIPLSVLSSCLSRSHGFL